MKKKNNADNHKTYEVIIKRVLTTTLQVSAVDGNEAIDRVIDERWDEVLNDTDNTNECISATYKKITN